jgi:hypothetical protein
MVAYFYHDAASFPRGWTVYHTKERNNDTKYKFSFCRTVFIVLPLLRVDALKTRHRDKTKVWKRLYEILMRQHEDKNIVLSPHIRRVSAIYLALSRSVACACVWYMYVLFIVKSRTWSLLISFRCVLAFR